MEMVYFNVIYENDTNDVDIICVPDYIAKRINYLSQKFLDWLPSATNDIYWTIIDGYKYSVCETDGFVKWLNDNYCKNDQMATIIKKHVQYVNKYDAIEF